MNINQSKAVSANYKPHIYLYGSEVKVDVDRLLSYMEEEFKRTQEVLSNPEGTVYEDKLIADFMGTYADTYEGLFNMILANEFK